MEYGYKSLPTNLILCLQSRAFHKFNIALNHQMKPATTKYLKRIPLLFLLPLIFDSTTVFSQKQYLVEYTFSGKDTLDNLHRQGLKTGFDNKESAKKYIDGLHATLLSKGFPAASVDSVFYDSLQARAKIYLGEKFKWAQISTDSLDKNVLESIGWNENQFENKELDFSQLQLAGAKNS